MSESNVTTTALEMLSVPTLRSERAGGMRILALATLFILVMLCIGIIFLEFSVRDEEAGLLASTSDRLQVSATGRAARRAAALYAGRPRRLSTANGPHGRLSRQRGRRGLRQRSRRADSRYSVVRPGTSPVLTPASLPAGEAPRAIRFGTRSGLDNPSEHLSVGVVVAGAHWVVLEEISKADALEPLGGYRLFGGLIVLLSTIGFAAAALAFWWRQGSENNRALAQQYHELAGRLQTQRQLLDAINGSIQEHVTVKDAEAKYIYANPAFARAVGLTDRALFQSDEAEQLATEDTEIISGGEVAAQIVALDVAGAERQFQLSKRPSSTTKAGGWASSPSPATSPTCWRPSACAKPR